jgi:hypothetical protein
MRDLYSNISAVPALPSGSRSAAANGEALDLLGARRAVFLVNTGTISGDGDFGVTIEESDDGLIWQPAPDGHVQSDAPATLEAESVYRLGYLGWKRHVRLALSKAGGTSVQVGAVAVLSPLTRPA